jgi:hypothetical protein
LEAIAADMDNVDELDLSVAAERVSDGIQSVANNAITAFHSGVYKHLPQQVCNFSRHKIPPPKWEFPL